MLWTQRASWTNTSDSAICQGVDAVCAHLVFYCLYMLFFYTCLPPILWRVSQYLFFYLFYCLICLFHICLPEVLWRVSQYLLFCLFCCLNNTTQHLPPQPTYTQVNSVNEYKCEAYILWDIYYVIRIYILGTVRTSFVTSVYNETVKL